MSSDDDAAPRPARRRRVLPPLAAFVLLGIANSAMYLSTGAPTPILLYLEEKWSFDPAMLTIAYAAYTGGLLVTLLTGGALSDFLGRRRIIIISLVIEVIVMVGFVFAPNIGWVTALRVFQGAGIGLATSAFTAIVVETAPERYKRLGSILGSLGPPLGLGIGALFGGIAVQFAVNPVAIIFVTLAIVTIACIGFVIYAPETVSRIPGALRSLIPVVSVPPRARRAFFTLLPLLLVAWMLPCLYMGLGPTIIRDVFHLDSGLLNGGVTFLLPTSSAVFGFAFGRLPLPRLLRMGGFGALAAALLWVISLTTGILPLFALGGIAGGLGYGLSVSAIVATYSPLALRHERGGLFAAMFLGGYLAFGLPSVAVSQLLEPWGVFSTVLGFAIAIAAVAVIAILAQVRAGPLVSEPAIE